MKYLKVSIMEVSPEAGIIDPNRLKEIPYGPGYKSPVIEGRTAGPFEGKAFYLDPIYDWVIGKDEHGSIILIPLTK